MPDGCRHSFTWTTNSTGSPTPPEGYMTWCAACGSWGRWEDGGWRATQESLGSLAMAQAERFGDALQEILSVLGPHGDRCPENACEGCRWEMAEAVRIIKEAMGV